MSATILPLNTKICQLVITIIIIFAILYCSKVVITEADVAELNVSS